jgi:hypothetical protein
MRCPPDAHVASVLSLLATLVLAGCRSDSPHAVIYADPASALATGAACVPEPAPTSAEVQALPTPLSPSPQELGVTSMQGGEPDTDVYARPPLHEVSYSTRTSDVGMAYPIPSAGLDTSTSSPPPATAAVPPPAARPFPETTFRPPYESTGFPESSFGPQAEP